MSIVNVLLIIQPCVELTLGIVCSLSNLYFSFRFRYLTQFSVNLRIILSFSHTAIAITSLTHPITAVLPKDWFLFRNGHYLTAAFAYTIFFVCKLSLLVMDSKYAMIGYERLQAFRKRANYENADGRMAQRMIFMTVFRYLSKKVKHHWYTSQSLSESYLIKEIDTVIGVLRPILFAFCVLVISAGTTTSIQIYLHLFHGMPFCVGVMQVLANCGYLSLAVYNIFSALYLIFGFPAMRKKLINDIQRLCGKRIENSRVGPQEINWSKEREDHFDYLDSIWK
ncbi:hypothetical protein M3Y96_00150100 [Aphelenchoides besseyi]|nr:hypothetical protein M3Y96_00150100 [Aphelenchoides besseyi]